MKVVIYARYSSSNQREESIEAQVRECKEYAKKNGMIVLDIYADSAISGTTDKRPEFQRMMADSDKKLFEGVIMYTLDRFARNRYDSAMYKYRLKKNGVKVFYAKQEIPDTPEGIMLESILEGYAEYYSENLARNVKRGLKENAIKGISIGNPGRPFGYDISPQNTYIINEKEAYYVKQMFLKYAQGDSITDITRYLNSENVKSKRGNDMTISSVLTILKNCKYLGVFRYMDTELKIPSIVTEELFNKVQERIQNSHKHVKGKKPAVEYPLSTKLICGYCGSSMVGTSGKSKKGKLYCYYVCYNQRIKKCNKKPEKKEVIEQIVYDAITDKVLTKDTIKKIASKVCEIAKEPDDNLLIIDKRLKEIQKKKNNLLKAIEEGIITSTTSARLKELEENEALLILEKEKLQIEKPSITEENIMDFFNSAIKGSIFERKRIFNTLIDKVYVYDSLSENKIIIVLNVREHNTITLNFSDIQQYALAECNPSKIVYTRNNIVLIIKN